MGRPADWSVAGLSGDPVPGDPAVIKSLAVSWATLADDAEWAKNRVNALLADGAVMDWIGKAGDAFRAHSSDLPGQLDKASRSYRSASLALSVWSSDLEGCQGTADKGLALAHQAQDDIAAAQRVLATARANETSAQNASKTLSDTSTKYKDQPPPAGVQLPDPSQVAAAAQRATAANNAVTTAQHTVDDAQTRLTAAKKLIGDAAHLRDDRATVAAASINAAAEEGIPPDSFWDDVGDVLSDVWHGIVEIAKIVVLVLGVVALIIGGPIAWVLLAAALVVLADTLIKYAQGKASLLDVGLALLSCIPMTKGLTTLAELSTAFKTGGMLGAGAHLLSSAKTTLVDMVQGIRSLTGNLKTTITNFRDTAAMQGLVGDSGFLRMGEIGAPSGGLRRLATSVPGGTEQAIHAGSADPAVLKAVWNREYGELTNVNAARIERMPGYDQNCTRCTATADLLLGGEKDLSAAPSLVPRPPTDIDLALGKSLNWHGASGYDQVVKEMMNAGEGARGAVVIYRSDGSGHVFNVVHDLNGVVFIDSQSGKFATLETSGVTKIFLGRTN